MGAGYHSSGAGNDILFGGSGAGEFVFSGTGFGFDTIGDFDVLEDRLLLFASLADGTLTAAEASAATTAIEGGIMLVLGGGNDIFLEGLIESDIAKIDIGIG